jgi:hypothetical protein
MRNLHSRPVIGRGAVRENCPARAVYHAALGASDAWVNLALNGGPLVRRADGVRFRGGHDRRAGAPAWRMP